MYIISLKYLGFLFETQADGMISGLLPFFKLKGKKA